MSDLSRSGGHGGEMWSSLVWSRDTDQSAKATEHPLRR